MAKGISMKKWLALLLILFPTTVFAADKLTVLLDWFMNPNHAPLFVAQQQGFFKKQGLDVTLIGPADPSDPPKLVAAGKADIAITYEPHFIEQVENGLPLIRIGTLVDRPLNCLAVLKDSSIKTVADLKNKRVGYSSGGVTSTALKVMLEKNGLSLKDVQLINVHYNLTQSLLSGKVDAVTGVMRNFEAIQMELAGHPARLFFQEDNGIPTYSELIFVAQKNRVHDPRLRQFLIAVEQGQAYLQTHPHAMWTAFANAHPELKDELNHRAWFASLPYFTQHPAKLNQSQWRQFIMFMQKNGLIKTVQPVNHYAVDLNHVD
jgi:putative hydroxymethylpyrimidine transport system substrate-binding protein